MRIKSVQAWWVQIPIEDRPPAPQRFRHADAPSTPPSCGSRPRTAWSAGAKARTPPAAPGNYAALVHLLNHEVAPQLIGRNAGDITAIWEMLYNGVARRARRRSRAMPCRRWRGAA